MDTRSSKATSGVQALLRASLELGDARQAALAAVDAVLSGAARDEVVGWIDEAPQRVSRTSAPPLDEVAALRHELANAMTAIAGIASQAERDGSPEAAVRAVSRIRALATDGVSDPRKHGSEVPASLRDVSVEFLELVGDLAAFAAEHHVEVEPRVEPGLQSRIGPSTFRLVVWNLLKNAIEASPPRSAVVVGVEQRDGALRITVEDRGIGLSAAIRARVFEPHFSTKDDGRGLGLSLVEAEVQRLGGYVDVSAPARGGSRFTVVLPRVQATQVPMHHAEERSGVVRRSPLRGTHVTLLSDFVFLERALMALGADVARTTLSALVSAGRVVDLLVADAAHVSVETAAQFRRDGLVRRVVFIAPEGEPPAPHAGVDAVVGHAFDLRELAETIYELLRAEQAAG